MVHVLLGSSSLHFYIHVFGPAYLRNESKKQILNMFVDLAKVHRMFLYCNVIWSFPWANLWDYVFFILRKLILPTRMRSHPMGLAVWLLVGFFDYFHPSCGQTVNALSRPRGCAFSDRLCVSTIILRADSNSRTSKIIVTFRYMFITMF